MGLLVPIAPMAPYPHLPVDIIPHITESVVSALDLSPQVIVAPLMPYGFVTPYKGFGTVLGMGRNSFPSFVKDLLLSAHAGGIRRVIFLVPLREDAQLISCAYKNYKVRLPGLICTSIAWQQLPTIQKALHSRFLNLEELWRSEALVAQLAHEVGEYPLHEHRGPLLNPQAVKMWYKRGMDPDKLQKLLREGTLSTWHGIRQEKIEPMLPLLTDAIKQTIHNFMEKA